MGLNGPSLLRCGMQKIQVFSSDLRKPVLLLLQQLILKGLKKPSYMRIIFQHKLSSMRLIEFCSNNKSPILKTLI